MNSARILIVEDEQVVARDLELTLEDRGYQVAGVAATAGQALFVAGKERPDLVLMDIHLHGHVDGVHAAGMIRAEFGVPVVFLTANTDDATLQRALEVGAGGFLAKPFNSRRVHQAIQVALGQGERERMMQIENSLLRRDSAVDALTGLFNRRYLDQVLDREIEFAERDQHPLSVIILDLDHFKTVNDEHGHAAGDAVLSGVAEVLRSRLRIYDVPCRYGGDELVVIAPGAGAAEAEVIAEALRCQIGETSFSDGGHELPGVTASFGIAVYPAHGKTTEDLLRAADGALYAAKAAGRNCVKVAQR
ncbi:MAG TPA: diguanylate cyclase [Polyangiaceae bacterium]|nr:diguanylate cyclase [Polyangiaceae bacterium]